MNNLPGKLREQANQHPLDVESDLFNVAAERIEDLQQKADAFDALIKMLDGKHERRHTPHFKLISNGDGTSRQEEVFSYEWRIRLDGSTDIRAGLLALSGSKFIQQTDITQDSGDCQRASVASLFGLELDQVPHFRLLPDDKWWDVFCSFIWELGYEVERFNEKFIDVKPTVGHLLLADIKSNFGDGFAHAVIVDVDGIVIHDPLPGNPNNGRNIINDLVCWYSIRKRYDSENAKNSPLKAD